MINMELLGSGKNWLAVGGMVLVFFIVIQYAIVASGLKLSWFPTL